MDGELMRCLQRKKIAGPCTKGHGQKSAMTNSDDGESASTSDEMTTSTDETEIEMMEVDGDEENTEDAETYHDLYAMHGLFNTDIISDMLSENQLSIDNYISYSTLRITMKPEWLSTNVSAELRRYIDAILKELEEFKKEHGLSDNCITFLKDSKGNLLSLRINIPDASLHQEFIARLSNKNLLPNQIKNSPEKANYEKGMNHFLTKRPSPRPSSKKKKDDMEDEVNFSNTYRRLNPFSTRLTR